MASILVFAGTTEGRKIAEYLRGHAPEVYVCTATEYGKELVEDGENIHVLAGRLDVAGMGELARGCQAELVIDATHPFAMEVSKNIRTMCEKADIPCVRVLREEYPGGRCLPGGQEGQYPDHHRQQRAGPLHPDPGLQEEMFPASALHKRGGGARGGERI